MMKTVEPRYWVAPALSSGADFKEPLQGGSVRQMGILKPWAPPRSYGLLIRLGPDLRPCYSLHSRVGGKNHGIVAAVEHGDFLIVLSKGAGRILRLPRSEERRVGQECVSTCRSRWSTYHCKKKNNQTPKHH